MTSSRRGFTVLPVLLLAASCAAHGTPSTPAAAPSGPLMVDVGGRRLFTFLAGEGDPTVVFEAGGGDYSAAWKNIAPEVRAQDHVRTFVYDRAGLGLSDPPAPGPYHIDDEVTALGRALDARGVRGPVVLVAHSYGGFVATVFAAQDARVKGVVLLDANLGAYFDDVTSARLVASFAPQFPALEQQAPEIARVMIPLMQAYPETARRVRAAGYPPDLPTIDIVAERSWGATPEENAGMARAHADFVAAAPASREAVFASGSGHLVVNDRPDLVLAAIAKMVARVRH
jgi:pimeloyl-ACP methyl ester carboxylesterase